MEGILAQGCMAIILLFMRLEQGVLEFETSLGYI